MDHVEPQNMTDSRDLVEIHDDPPNDDQITQPNKGSSSRRARNNSNTDNDAGDVSEDLLSELDDEDLNDMDDDDGTPPVAIDENITKTLKASKRKPADGEGSATGKKPKEGRRVKKRAREDEELGSADGASGSNNSDRRPRKGTRIATEGVRRKGNSSQKQPSKDESDENLTPEERRRKALDRAIDAAIKKPTRRRRKKDEVDLEAEVDEEIASLKVRMEKACVADNDAREAGRPAVNKLKLLPEVTALLNRNTVQDAVLDPETNFLQSVKYFLEPLNDGSLPAYSIQRDIFTALTKLPVEKEALLSSGIGKVVLFYTRSKRPEVSIKRMAERLMGEWSRPILKRTDDYKKRHIETRDFDYVAAKRAQRQAAILGSQFPQYVVTQRHSTVLSGAVTSRAEYELEASQPPKLTTNVANPLTLPASYTVAPRSTYDGSDTLDHRPIGAAGAEAFRKMQNKNMKDRGLKRRD